MPLGSKRVPDVFDGLTWVDIDSPVTRGWWAVERDGERLVLLQPFQRRIATVSYTIRTVVSASRCLACQLAIGWLSASRIKVAFTDEELRGSGSRWIGSASSAVVDAMDASRGLLNLE